MTPQEVLDYIKDIPGSDTGNLLAGIGGAAAQQKIISDIEKLGERDVAAVFGQPTVPQYEGGILGEIQRQSEFKPFTTLAGLPLTKASLAAQLVSLV